VREAGLQDLLEWARGVSTKGEEAFWSLLNEVTSLKQMEGGPARADLGFDVDEFLDRALNRYFPLISRVNCLGGGR